MIKLKEDLEAILSQTAHLWKDISGQTLFISGGTGFFGKWLLSSFLHINNALKLDNNIIVLSRNPDKFVSENPQFSNHASLKFVKGDIRNFTYPEDKIDYIIHAATEASVFLNNTQPLLMYDTIVDGTRHILELAKIKNTKAVLHTSSGAVYGSQPSDVTHLKESYLGCPDIYKPNAAYGEGKRVAEMMASLYHKNHNVKSVIARCFAFIGPYLPLEGEFAAGNFIYNLINNKNIEVNGDGTPFRSYLYASDLVIWLWTLMIKGKPCQPYNVGSDIQITIKELAELISSFKKDISVNVAKPVNEKLKPQRYVPSVDLAKSEFGLKISVSLLDSIKKTINFYQS